MLTREVLLSCLHVDVSYIIRLVVNMWNTTSKSVNLLDRLDFDIEARCLIKKNIQVCKIRARQFCDRCTNNVKS
jgi:hypothetical protein